MNYDDYQVAAERTSGAKGVLYQGKVDWKGKQEALAGCIEAGMKALPGEVDLSLLLEEVKKARGERRFMAACMGLVGETIELSCSTTETREKEAGDCSWYLAEVCSCLGIRVSELLSVAGSFGDPIQFMINAAGQIVELGKKVTAHGHVLDKGRFQYLLSKYLDLWNNYCIHHSLDRKIVLEKNIEKLHKRYGEAFSKEASENRKE